MLDKTAWLIVFPNLISSLAAVMMDSGSNPSVSKRSLRRNQNSKNYDEKLMDQLIESHLGGTSRKKNRTKQELEKETETEAMIAFSLGFPIDDLLAEEIKARVINELGGKEQNDYIVVRNHILAKWRDNVRTWLTKPQIRETISNEYEHLISSAYDFLFYNGYINFGVSPAFKYYTPEETTECSVVVIGAGLAGLAAARQLRSFGFKVVVLEGRNRPGGRVYTQNMGQSGHFAAVDLGGSVITGTHMNPLGVLARQLAVPLHKVRDKCPLYKPDGSPVSDETDAKVELIFNKLLDKVTELRQITGSLSDISLGSVLDKLLQLYAVVRTSDEEQLLDWHFANLEYANAGKLSDLSAAYWDQDDPFEMGGDHCFLAGGNSKLVKSLCEGLPIFYGTVVRTVRYGDQGVEIITSGNQTFRADVALCTVPLGVLKKKSIRFEPELPERKITAISRLGFGLLNKVAMVFSHVFWGEELDTFGCLNKFREKRGEFFLFYSYHTVSGGSVLVAFVAGEAAETFEHANPAYSLHCVLRILRDIYGPKGITVPDPIQSICTKWGSDPLSYGSYSHVSVKSSGSDYDILAESVGNRLFFAGEATNRQYPATMHGAYLSGLREASCIFRSHQTDNQIKKNAGPSNETLYDLFKNPDLAFGSFSFIFDNENAIPMGIMRVTFGNCDERDICEQLMNPMVNLYTVLKKEQALELGQVAGSNDFKLTYLTENLGLELIGADALGSLGNILTTNIANARRGRGRSRLFGSV